MLWVSQHLNISRKTSSGSVPIGNCWLSKTAGVSLNSAPIPKEKCITTHLDHLGRLLFFGDLKHAWLDSGMTLQLLFDSNILVRTRLGNHMHNSVHIQLIPCDSESESEWYVTGVMSVLEMNCRHHLNHAEGVPAHSLYMPAHNV